MKNKIFVAFIFCTVATALVAQPKKDIQEQQFTIEREYRPVLADAVKLQLNPDLPPIDNTAPTLTYNIPDKYLRIPYEAPDVRPLAMKSVQLENLKNVYAKLGAGNRALPYLDIYLNSGRRESTSRSTNNLNLGAHIGYLNSNGPDDQDFSDFDSKVFGTFFTEMVAFGAEANYNRDVINFYGFDNTDTTFVPGDIRQRYNFFDFAFNVKNAAKNDFNLDYKGTIDVNYLADVFEHKEINPLIDLSLNKQLNESSSIIGEIGFDYNKFTYDTLETSFSIFKFNPVYRLKKDKWVADLGLNLGTVSGEFEEGFYIFPDLRFDMSLIGKSLVFTSELTGKIVKNNYKVLTDYNPFLDNDVMLKNSEDIKVSVGFRGAPLDKVNYAVKVNYNNINYLPLFVNDSINYNKFDVVYDSSAFVLNLHGEIGYTFSEKLRVTATGDFFSYNLSNIAEAWHLPTAKASIYVNYNITDKLSAQADLFVFNNINARTPAGEVQQLKGLVDINLGASYKISESFHIFANVYNIASTKHQRWYNYPSYGLNALAGIALHF